MPLLDPAPDLRRRDRMLLVLTGGAGCADALGYLGLGHVFTANMSGNTALLGLHIALGDGAAALRSLTALVAFGLGLAIGAWIAGRPASGGWPSSVTRALAAESVVLAAFVAVAHAVGPERGHLAEPRADRALGNRDGHAERGGVAPRRPWHRDHVPHGHVHERRHRIRRAGPRRVGRPGRGARRAAQTPRGGGVGLQFLDLVVYGVGALIGGGVFIRWPTWVGVLPFAAVGGVVLLALRARPMDSR